MSSVRGEATDRRLLALVIDDDAGEVEILRRHLQEVRGIEVELAHAGDRAEAEAVLRDRAVGLVFLDYQLGGENGVDLLVDLRAQGDLRPVIALTGRGDEYAAAGLVRAGADDYIVKSDLAPEVVRRAIESAQAQFGRRVAEREALRNAQRLEHANRQLEASQARIEAMNRRLRELSNTDPLTGIANRRYFFERCEAEFARLEREGGSLALVMLDVDRFKRINDVHGHQVGDRALVAVAEALCSGVRRYDLAARLGGEEFAVLLPHARREGAWSVSERCRDAIREIRLGLGREPRGLSASAGIALVPGPDLATLDDLIRVADAALYAAKRAGRDCALEAGSHGLVPASAAPPNGA